MVVIVTDSVDSDNISVWVNTDGTSLGTRCSLLGLGVTSPQTFEVFRCGDAYLPGNTVVVTAFGSLGFCGIGIFPLSCTAVPDSETWGGTVPTVSYTVSDTMTAYDLPSLTLLQ